jgi:hypothetical protein
MLLFDPGSSPLSLCARNVLNVDYIGQGAQVTILSDCRLSVKPENVSLRGGLCAFVVRFLRETVAGRKSSKSQGW